MARFPNLTVPTVCTADAAQIAAQTIAEYEGDFLAVQGLSKTLAPGDPVRLLLLRYAARESQLRNLINYGFQQNFIITANGNNLDAIGSNYGTRGLRLPASNAVTSLTFTLASAVNVNIVIPFQTQVAAGSVVFQTNQLVTLLANTTSISVLATCKQAGIIGNGYTAGQINTLVGGNFPFVVTATNTTTSIGGADVEQDDPYAQRLALVPGSFSVAGPAVAYEFWARTASAAISDVSIVGPPDVAAGNVYVYVLLQNGVLPDSPFLATVTSFLGGDVRPLTDTVTVLAPTVTNYNITLTYYIDPSNSPLTTQIQAAVTQAIADFIAWTKAKIGRTINRAYLTQKLMEAGASDVVITLPADTPLDAAHVGIQSGTMVITYGGLRNE
jgi:phage-related baseplate assembly protein